MHYTEIIKLETSLALCIKAFSIMHYGIMHVGRYCRCTVKPLYNRPYPLLNGILLNLIAENVNSPGLPAQIIYFYLCMTENYNRKIFG